MKFSFVIALVAAATVVSAESNAARLARGLSPNAPVKRGTQTYRECCGTFTVLWPSSYPGARRSTPSTTPGECDTGSVYCCNTLGYSDDEYFSGLISDFGIEGVSPNTYCGSGCSSMGIGVGNGANW